MGRWIPISEHVMCARDVMTLSTARGDLRPELNGLAAARVFAAIDEAFLLRQETIEQGDFEDLIWWSREAIDCMQLESASAVRAFLKDQQKDLDEETIAWMFPHLFIEDSEEYRAFDRFLEEILSTER